MRTYPVCLRMQPLELGRLRCWTDISTSRRFNLRNMRIDDVPQVSLFDNTHKEAEDKPADLRLNPRPRARGTRTPMHAYTRSGAGVREDMTIAEIRIAP